MKRNSRQNIFEENLSKMLNSSMNKADSAFEENLTEAVLAEVKKQRSVVNNRLFFKKRSFVAAAAVVIVVGVLLLSAIFLDKSVSSAYALEHTIKAYLDVRYVHLKSKYIEDTKEYPENEIWVQLDEISNVVGIWTKAPEQEDFTGRMWDYETKIFREWNPAKNQFTIQYILGQDWLTPEYRMNIDPKYIIEILYELEAKGDISIEIEEPSQKVANIRVIATQTDEFMRSKESGWARRRYVLLIDPDTKLVRQLELYKLLNNEYKLRSRISFLDYGEGGLDPDKFIAEAPSGAEIINLTQGIGMPQGNLTDTEAASEVVRQYIEALIAKDYYLCARISPPMRPLLGGGGSGPDYSGGLSGCAKRIEERIKSRRIKYVRVVDIGESKPALQWGPRAYWMPYEFEIETANGERRIVGPRVAFSESEPGPREHREALVIPVPGKPDLWVIAVRFD
ncbi:MAG: hypothetical protein ACFFCW_31335 [Candidatus Hodarchaeota archaeon]